MYVQKLRVGLSSGEIFERYFNVRVSCPSLCALANPRRLRPGCPSIPVPDEARRKGGCEGQLSAA